MKRNVKYLTRYIWISSEMAHGADELADQAETDSRYKKISKNAKREAKKFIADLLIEISPVDRLIIAQWMDGATFLETAEAKRWSDTWMNHRFNVVIN